MYTAKVRLGFRSGLSLFFQRRMVLALVLGSALAAAPPVSAETVAINVPPALRVVRDFTGAGDSVDGWKFAPTADIYVLSLGYFDADDNGMVSTHQVAIYASATATLVTSVVAIDSLDPLKERFRFEQITPVLLQAGVAYTIAGTSARPFDPWVSGGVTTFDIDPIVGFRNYRFAFGATLTMPTSTLGGTGLTLGPNFTFQLQDPIANGASSWGQVKSLFE